MLIAFNGRMGVGKSEAILRLAELSATPIKLVKFAQPLYDMQEMIYNRIASVYQRPADFKKDRKLLQWLGTDWGRDTISQNIWVDIWKAEVLAAQAAGYLAVCDDVRFDNEAQVVKSLGGSIIKIISERGLDRAQGGQGFANHASEAGISGEYVDYILENNATLAEYKDSLTYLFKEHLLVGSKHGG